MTFPSGSLRDVLKFQAALEADCKETPQLSWKCSQCGRGEREAFKDKKSEAGGAELLSSQMELISASPGCPTGLYLLQLQEQQSCLCWISCPAQGRWDVGQKVLLGKAVTY